MPPCKMLHPLIFRERRLSPECSMVCRLHSIRQVHTSKKLDVTPLTIWRVFRPDVRSCSAEEVASILNILHPWRPLFLPPLTKLKRLTRQRRNSSVSALSSILTTFRSNSLPVELLSL